MLRATRARQWHHWRNDYRCDRPPVTCRGCGRHYPPHESANVMTFFGNALVSCSECDKPKPKPEPPIFSGRVRHSVGRDVACRYIVRFDGRTHREITAIDDYEVYLVNRHNEVIAIVSSFDTFPKAVDTEIFDDIPF